jgi:hypothetical protein
MPFGIFVGIENHGRTILFGYALIRNETVSTFRWLMKVSSYTSFFSINFGRLFLSSFLIVSPCIFYLFSLLQTFVTLMKKFPKTIITDQDPWMNQAIAFEMPSTKHAFCIWHITAKFSGWFTTLLQFFEIDTFHSVLIFINFTSLTTLTILKKNGL